MLIYLNGTSSSGKTSIAKELQSLIPGPCLYFSIDALLYALATEDLDAIMGKRPYRYTINWNSIFEGYFASVAALVNAGNTVIADNPVYTEKLAGEFAKTIDPILKKLVVKLDCPLDELERREKAREDRAIGIAKNQIEGIHRFLKYDMDVDSHQSNPKQVALKIFKQASDSIFS